MEILKNHNSSTKFVVPTDLTVATAKTYRNGEQLGNSQQATVSGGVAEVSIPYAATVLDGPITIELRFNYGGDTYTQKQEIEVVTPHLNLWEVKEIIEDNDDINAARAEAAARHIINAHCGQLFGKYEGKLSITGGGEGSLRMPRRLLSFKNINGNDYWSDALTVRGNGWYLQSKVLAGPPSIRADYDGWHYEPNSGVITPPPVRDYANFTKNIEYVIDGVWGWESVPERIAEASRLLINDYACGDSLYRDRFLTSMTAADWRIQFHDGAFSNTGNVRADQLLTEYTLRRGWVIV